MKDCEWTWLVFKFRENVCGRQLIFLQLISKSGAQH